MQEDNQLIAHIANIKLELSSVKEQLFSLRDTIKSAEQELESLIQIILSPSTQSDTHVCKCKETTCADVTSTSGENTKTEDQQMLDLAKTVENYLKMWAYVEPYSAKKRFLIM